MYFTKTIAATALLLLVQLAGAAPTIETTSLLPREPSSEDTSLAAREPLRGTLIDRAATPGTFTYYNVETGSVGACGSRNRNTDMVVAMASADFKQSNCFRKLRVKYNGKTILVQVTDSCPGCKKGGLDLSQGAFKQLANLNVGLIKGTWEFA
ncbi:RlpA-like double-psi beta-barrel-protein domain-containing protein-containing protein [Podospora didyma]|uniref:RlpA-like double-psi beta-barrel-protein domain-containing protein-containing protein n=1 Tax=Podospora didyma TaxID=330526 RepID=A0AAE0TYZ8_9PEZI|nr:RlpA-like double-psi beta-barrel-protein domain-containing protein-containing protein [Podospora didyma]